MFDQDIRYRHDRCVCGVDAKGGDGTALTHALEIRRDDLMLVVTTHSCYTQTDVSVLCPKGAFFYTKGIALKPK